MPHRRCRLGTHLSNISSPMDIAFHSLALVREHRRTLPVVVGGVLVVCRGFVDGAHGPRHRGQRLVVSVVGGTGFQQMCKWPFCGGWRVCRWVWGPAAFWRPRTQPTLSALCLALSAQEAPCHANPSREHRRRTSAPEPKAYAPEQGLLPLSVLCHAPPFIGC